MTKRNLTRRSLLQQAFFSALSFGAAPVWAGASGNACVPVAGRDQLKLPLGRLAAIGALQPVNELGVALPEGFSIRMLAQAGKRVPTPAGKNSRSHYSWHTFPDGGAVIPRSDGGWVYTSNSEIPLLPLGGCGALAFNAHGAVEDAYSILKSTTQNCAGGTTPWNSWISCEESKDGLCWECDPFLPGQGVAKPALGRFAHEAVAVDVQRRSVYLTEDIVDGRFYRWTASEQDVDENGRMALEQGVLEVMNIVGFHDDCYPQSDALVQRELAVSWVPVTESQRRQDKVRETLRAGRKAVPGTIFAGGEGLWSYRVPEATARALRSRSAPAAVDTLIFWTTKIDNRVWVLDVANQRVELIFDNSQIDTPFKSVDNLTVSPWGDVLVAEDPVESDVARLIEIGRAHV